MGGSAGGMLMGGIANMRPDLWKGIVAAVPFVDVVIANEEDAQDVLIAITGMSPGDTAQLSILRKRSTEQLMVRVAERPARFTERPARRR